MTSLQTLANYDFAGQNEQAIREEWIYPLLQQLGYGAGTLNRIKFEQPVELRDPVRQLGSSKFQVDYQPTVLSRGLWLIEAKRPSADTKNPKHLGQAWSYATHPEINVPLMAIADGSSIVVYDVTRVKWEEPVADIPARELLDRFQELVHVLGAKSVAAFVRKSLFSKLQQALEAELDLNVLNTVVDEVRAIAERARPSILENRQSVRADQRNQDQIVQDRIDRYAGLWGMAQEVNGPTGISSHHVDRAVGILTGVSANGRAAEFGRLFDAARSPSPAGPIRAWGALRVLRLAVALVVREKDGCSWAEPTIADSVRDHLLGFPEDPLVAAAHGFERVLSSVAVRIFSDPEIVDNASKLSLWESTADEEQQLRRPGSPEGMALGQIERSCRQIWNSVDWTLPGIRDMQGGATKLLNALPATSSPIAIFAGQNQTSMMNWDMLVAQTIFFIERHGSAADVPEEAWEVIEKFVDAPAAFGLAAAALIADRSGPSGPVSPT